MVRGSRTTRRGRAALRWIRSSRWPAVSRPSQAQRSATSMIASDSSCPQAYRSGRFSRRPPIGAALVSEDARACADWTPSRKILVLKKSPATWAGLQVAGRVSPQVAVQINACPKTQSLEVGPLERRNLTRTSNRRSSGRSCSRPSARPRPCCTSRTAALLPGSGSWRRRPVAWRALRTRPSSPR